MEHTKQKNYKKDQNIKAYSIVVGVATNSCLLCQTALVAYGIATSPKYLYWGRKEDITMYCWYANAQYSTVWSQAVHSGWGRRSPTGWNVSQLNHKQNYNNNVNVKKTCELVVVTSKKLIELKSNNSIQLRTNEIQSQV